MTGHRSARRVAVGAALAVAAATLVHPTAANAEDTCTISWTGGSGSWTDPARWSPARVPTPDDDVCVVRAAGAGPVSVRLTTSADVASTTLRGATLAVASGAFLDVSQVVASQAVLSGGGSLRGSNGIFDLRDTRLVGFHVSTPSRVILNGQITFTGGATLDSSGFTEPRPGVRIVDGDGNGANHIGLSQFPLYLGGPIFVGVRLGLTSVTLLALRGDVVLAALDNLDLDGNLEAATRTTLQFGASTGASLTLPRPVTGIGGRVSVYASGDIRTPDGDNALSGLTRVDGYLGVGQQLVTRAPLVVRGTLSASASLIGPPIAVRAGGTFAATRVNGALSCAGSCDLTGAHVGQLTLLAGSTTTTDFDQPITVDGTAKLGGRLSVGLTFGGGGPKPGVTHVLLTAARGVTGSFTDVTTPRPHRSVTAGYLPTYVTGTLAATA